MGRSGATRKSLLPHALAPGLLLLAACTQTLTTDGELSTRSAELKDAAKCRHLGNAQVAVKLELILGDKNAGAAANLLVKARNLASEIGADTVVPAGEITDGVQNFRLYLCAPPS